MTLWTREIISALVAFGAVALAMPVVRWLALRFGVMDHPAWNKAHHVATPYLGGLPIGFAAAATLLVPNSWRAEAAVILVASIVVGTIGLVDDIRTVSPGSRLFVEAAAAVAVWIAGARVEIVGGLGSLVLTVCWLVVLTNAFNLLDNMDGCAGVIAAVTAVGLAVSAGLEGQRLVGALAAVTAGATLGFLVHNWPPARIFMGDAGSLLLGFLLATTALELRFPVDHSASAAAVALFAAPALFDTTLVVLSRLAARRTVYIGGTDHTSHRLARLGMPTSAVISVLALATGGCATLAVLVGRGALAAEVVLPAVAVIAAVALVALLAVRVYVDDVDDVAVQTAGEAL